MSNIPNGWAAIKLGDIMELAYGKSLPKGNRNADGKYPVYGSNGIVGYHDSFLINGPSIIVGRKGGAGIATYAPENCWPIDTTYFINPSRIYNLKFAYHLISSLRLSRFDRSTAIPGLNRDDAYALSILLPPFNEQCRIVAKIEELFSELEKGIESLKTARAQLKVYRQAILKHAFEGKLTAEWREKNAHEKWRSMRINDTAEKIVDCLHSTPKFSHDGKYCIDSTWVENNKLLIEGARFVSKEIYLERIKRLKPRTGDVLFVREGSKKIGTALVANFAFDFCLGQRMMMFRLHKNIHPQYFTYYIQSDNFQKQYKPLIGGSASPHLNISDIKRMEFPLCVLNEQEEIVRQIDSQFSVVDALDDAINMELQKSESLRQSILKRAFSGQLVAQDPADEPASVLLERILVEKGKNLDKKPKTKRRAA